MPIAESPSPRIALLTSLVEADGVQYGREDSFKISHGSVLDQRFMLGVPTRGLTTAQLSRWCTALGMPERFNRRLFEQMADANLVFLGIEDGQDEGIFKIYLEFWDKVKRHVEATRRFDPLLLHLGYKWRAGSDGADGRIARYTCFPMLSVRDTLTRIQQVYGGLGESSACGLAIDIVRQAAAANPRALFIYAEVEEEGTPRRSFDINLYKSGLTLADLRGHLARLQQHFSIPEHQWTPLIARTSTRLLGHVSGGLDRANCDFLTLYYETRALDL